MATEVTTILTLPEDEAYALAELCKRISWANARELAVDEAETRRMLMACDRVRAALATEGIYVR